MIKPEEKKEIIKPEDKEITVPKEKEEIIEPEDKGRIKPEDKEVKPIIKT